jgi:hypothetical protein
MNCSEPDKWLKDFDDLTEEEIDELLAHAIHCEYHNNLVSAYEMRFDSLLSVYYEKVLQFEEIKKDSGVRNKSYPNFF